MHFTINVFELFRVLTNHCAISPPSLSFSLHPQTNGSMQISGVGSMDGRGYACRFHLLLFVFFGGGGFAYLLKTIKLLLLDPVFFFFFFFIFSFFFLFSFLCVDTVLNVFRATAEQGVFSTVPPSVLNRFFNSLSTMMGNCTLIVRSVHASFFCCHFLLTDIEKI